jgi:predicted nucleic acid-binding protein
LRGSPNAVIVSPGARHWEIFDSLLAQSGAIGNLVSDAWYAALAIEHGCELVSDDSDFARFPALRWRRPG